MSEYDQLFTTPGKESLLALCGVTNNTEKYRRIRAYLEFAQSRVDKQESFILCGSTVWGKDDGSGKPTTSSDIDVLVVAENLDFASSIDSLKEPPMTVKAAWQANELDRVTIFGKLGGIKTSFSVVKPELFKRICSGENLVYTSFRYKDESYKQGDHFFGIGFEHKYDFALTNKDYENGFITTDPSNQTVAPDGRFMMGHIYNRILTGVPYPDYFGASKTRQEFCLYFREAYDSEKAEHIVDFLHPFVWIRNDWDTNYEAALINYLQP